MSNLTTKPTKKPWKLSGLRDNSFSVGAINHKDDLEMANDLDFMLANPEPKNPNKKTPMQRAMEKAASNV